jgi:hypothetical protein
MSVVSLGEVHYVLLKHVGEQRARPVALSPPKHGLSPFVVNTSGLELNSF